MNPYRSETILLTESTMASAPLSPQPQVSYYVEQDILGVSGMIRSSHNYVHFPF